MKSIGGSPTNVAVALARLGRRAAVFTKVGDDALGDYARTALAEEFGVDTRFVGTHPTLQTPIVVAALDPPEDPEFVFYRQPCAPDSTITVEEVDLELVAAVPILWVSAGALAVEPSRGTTPCTPRAAGTPAPHDPRPRLPPVVLGERGGGPPRDRRDARATSTIAIGNRAECEVAVVCDRSRWAAERSSAAGSRWRS